MPDYNPLKQLSCYLKGNKGIETEFGHINIKHSNILGQGGNGIVYLGEINGTQLAIKFLLNYNTQKLNRFRAEYLNTSILRDKLFNTVNCINYGIKTIDGQEFPYIIMKKYEGSLKKYRQKFNEIKFQQVWNLFNSLCESIFSLEQCKIIHRDLKPENILIDENGNYIISDFGIAHFDSEDSPVKGLTKKGERLANFEFSAPEQISGGKISYATDIYAMAQIIYWFVFGNVNRGTGGSLLQSVYQDEEAKYLDAVMHKCLNNDPTDRFSNIEEIIDAINTMNEKNKKINPFDDMYKLSEIVSSTVPEFYENVTYTENFDEIHTLIHKIDKADFKRNLQFNTGIGNNEISSIIPLDNGNYQLNNYKEIKIKRIWGSFSEDFYNDILILELDKIEPYVIDGKKYYDVAKINDDIFVPYNKLSSGYIKYKGNVCDTRKLKIQERCIHTIEHGNYKEKYMAIGTFAQCTIIEKNDSYMKSLQEYDNLNEDLIIEFKKCISGNRSKDVYEYL